MAIWIHVMSHHSVCVYSDVTLHESTVTSLCMSPQWRHSVCVYSDVTLYVSTVTSLCMCPQWCHSVYVHNDETIHNDVTLNVNTVRHSVYPQWRHSVCIHCDVTLYSQWRHRVYINSDVITCYVYPHWRHTVYPQWRDCVSRLVTSLCDCIHGDVILFVCTYPGRRWMRLGCNQL